MDPLDAFPHVLLLFLLQHQLNEQLLQLLVAVVDTELLKAATHIHNDAKLLKAVTHKHNNGELLKAATHIHDNAELLKAVTHKKHDNAELLKAVTQT